MDTAKAVEIVNRLDRGDKVLDIGGGASPFPRADYVLDAISYDERSSLGEMDIDVDQRFSKETWIQWDVCNRKPWPFEDKQFDFAVCSHLLEDIRDPVWVCSEMCRVAKAGYIETPSRIVEQSRGVEHPSYAGFYHHRWLVSLEDGCLDFRFKPHSLHAISSAVVADVGISTRINPKHEILTLEWKDSFKYAERMEFNENKVNTELCTFAEDARKKPDLVVPNDKPLIWRLKRWVYFQRLKSS